MPAANTPRAVWTGSISFGLVNAPVRMYTAISEKDLRFNLIHEPDNGRIGYVKTCKVDGKEVTEAGTISLQPGAPRVHKSVTFTWDGTADELAQAVGMRAYDRDGNLVGSWER